MSAARSLVTVAIDVDGVVCPFVDPLDPRHHERETGWAYTSYSRGSLEAIAADPLVQTLFELGDSGGGNRGGASEGAPAAVAVLWHTSRWLDASERLAPSLGLPGLSGGAERMFATKDEFLGLTGAAKPSRWWKLVAIERWLHEHPVGAAGEHELLVWIDDDIADAVRSGEIPAELQNDPRLVMISPAIHTGMNPRELALLRLLTGLS